MPVSRASDVISGYYGFQNFGDDLFRDLLSESLASRPWSHVVISQNQVAKLPRLKRNVRALKNIASARSLTLGGGSILGARTPISIRHLEMAAASFAKMNYCAIGVGVLEGLKRPPTDLLQRMSWVGLRSARDYAELKAANAHVHYSFDLAYGSDILGPVAIVANVSDRPVSIIPAAVGELGNRIKSQQEASAWIRANLPPLIGGTNLVKVLLLQPTNSKDAKLCEFWRMQLNSEGFPAIVVPHENAKSTMSEIGSSSFVFTDRLHGGIVAHYLGVPFRMSQHHEKCRDFLTDVAHPDAGTDGYVADWSDNGVQKARFWSDKQSEQISRLSDITNSAIQNWLDHLESRLN